jgi:hypothetical protein
MLTDMVRDQAAIGVVTATGRGPDDEIDILAFVEIVFGPARLGKSDRQNGNQHGTA